MRDPEFLRQHRARMKKIHNIMLKPLFFFEKASLFLWISMIFLFGLFGSLLLHSCSNHLGEIMSLIRSEKALIKDPPKSQKDIGKDDLGVGKI